MLTKICYIAAIGAVQKNAYIVDFEICWKMSTSIYYLLAKIGVDTAENEPEIQI